MRARRFFRNNHSGRFIIEEDANGRSKKRWLGVQTERLCGIMNVLSSTSMARNDVGPLTKNSMKQLCTSSVLIMNCRQSRPVSSMRYDTFCEMASGLMDGFSSVSLYLESKRSLSVGRIRSHLIGSRGRPGRGRSTESKKLDSITRRHRHQRATHFSRLGWSKGMNE